MRGSEEIRGRLEEAARRLDLVEPGGGGLVAALRLLSSLAREPPDQLVGSPVPRALAALLSRLLGSALPSLPQMKKELLHFDLLWFLCFYLNSVYLSLDKETAQNQKDSFFMSVHLLRECCRDPTLRKEWKLSGRMCWLFNYIHKMLQFPEFMDYFCSHKGISCTAMYLEESLVRQEYCGCDMTKDQMILLIIVSTAVHECPVSAYSSRIIPMFIKYLDQMSTFFTLFLQDHRYEQIVTSMISVIGTLCFHVDAAIEMVDEDSMDVLLKYTAIPNVAIYIRILMDQKWLMQLARKMSILSVQLKLLKSTEKNKLKQKDRNIRKNYFKSVRSFDNLQMKQKKKRPSELILGSQTGELLELWEEEKQKIDVPNIFEIHKNEEVICEKNLSLENISKMDESYTSKDEEHILFNNIYYSQTDVSLDLNSNKDIFSQSFISEKDVSLDLNSDKEILSKGFISQQDVSLELNCDKQILSVEFISRKDIALDVNSDKEILSKDFISQKDVSLDLNSDKEILSKGFISQQDVSLELNCDKQILSAEFISRKDIALDVNSDKEILSKDFISQKDVSLDLNSGKEILPEGFISQKDVFLDLNSDKEILNNGSISQNDVSLDLIPDKEILSNDSISQNDVFQDLIPDKVMSKPVYEIHTIKTQAVNEKDIFSGLNFEIDGTENDSSEQEVPHILSCEKDIFSNSSFQKQFCSELSPKNIFSSQMSCENDLSEQSISKTDFSVSLCREKIIPLAAPLSPIPGKLKSSGKSESKILKTGRRMEKIKSKPSRVEEILDGYEASNMNENLVFLKEAEEKSGIIVKKEKNEVVRKTELEKDEVVKKSYMGEKLDPFDFKEESETDLGCSEKERDAGRGRKRRKNCGGSERSSMVLRERRPVHQDLVGLLGDRVRRVETPRQGRASARHNRQAQASDCRLQHEKC